MGIAGRIVVCIGIVAAHACADSDPRPPVSAHAPSTPIGAGAGSPVHGSPPPGTVDPGTPPPGGPDSGTSVDGPFGNPLFDASVTATDGFSADPSIVDSTLGPAVVRDP